MQTAAKHAHHVKMDIDAAATELHQMWDDNGGSNQLQR
jgi:hypothetical protein